MTQQSEKSPLSVLHLAIPVMIAMMGVAVEYGILQSQMSANAKSIEVLQRQWEKLDSHYDELLKENATLKAELQCIDKPKK